MPAIICWLHASAWALAVLDALPGVFPVVPYETTPRAHDELLGPSATPELVRIHHSPITQDMPPGSFGDRSGFTLSDCLVPAVERTPWYPSQSARNSTEGQLAL